MLAKLLTAAVSMVAVPTMFLAVGTQDQNDQAAAPAAIATVPGQASTSTLWSRTPSASFPRPTTVFGLTGRNSTDNKIQEATKAMRQAESSSERAEAKDKLVALLSEDYDSRLSDYEEHLEDLEKQLDEMRAKLKKRRQAKDDMIDLRIKVLEAEADDLGWPTRVRRGRSIGITSPHLSLPPSSARYETRRGSRVTGSRNEKSGR